MQAKKQIKELRNNMLKIWAGLQWIWSLPSGALDTTAGSTVANHTAISLCGPFLIVDL